MSQQRHLHNDVTELVSGSVVFGLRHIGLILIVSVLNTLLVSNFAAQ